MARGYNLRKSRWNSGKGKKKKKFYHNQGSDPVISKYTLKTKAIDSQVEKTILRISEEVSKAESWQTSRVEHFAHDEGFTSSHARPTFANMVELQPGTIWFQDITQLPTDSTDNTQQTLPGKYEIKTIQSRLRFYSKNLEAQTDVAPVCIRVALIKINNSGRKSVLAGGSNINCDIWPNSSMIADTNLRYSGIHKQDLKKTVPYDAKAVTIAQQKFWLGTNKGTNGGRADGANSDNSTASVVKEVILTKTYQNPLIHYQVEQETTVDSVLSLAQNKSKIIGDRIWLCILSDQQADFAFYGVSGCVYNYSEVEGLPSIPLLEDSEIIGGQNN